MKDKNNIRIIRRNFILICCFIMLIISNIFNQTNAQSVTNIQEQSILYNQSNMLPSVSSHLNAQIDNNDQFTYLSDIKYQNAKVGWGSLSLDKDNSNNPLTLMYEGRVTTFKKGIFAHANSQVIYDISNYDYRYFTAFVGLNTTSTRGDGVKFSIFTSEDGKNWGTAKYEEIKLPLQEASFVKIELENANYIKLMADQLKSNASDHSVYADAKLTNDINNSSAFPTIEEYDEIIKELYNSQNDVTDELENTILKRKFISSVGNYTLNSFYNESDDNKAVIDWLMSNQDVLRYYILGGKPLGNDYYKSLTELSRLYRNYKEDFENTEITKYGTVLGDLYLRMATSLSLTHSTTVGLWMNSSIPENKSDSVRRYAIIKYMHKNNLFQGPDGIDYNKWFENYTVEEMRYVMANNIDDESMLWLNSYVRELIQKEGGARLWPHRYIAYVWPNYGNPVYYAEENKEYFNNLFSVRDPNNEEKRIGLWDVVYSIPGGVDEPEYKFQISRGTSTNKVYKVWMNMRNKFGTGAVCGGISKVGANIRGVLGLPDAVVGQPGHAAHINYFQNSKGEGYWGIDNDVSGWAYTGSSILLGWSSAPYASGYTGTYIPLAQEVINHEDTYKQSQMFVYLADSYTDLTKKEEAYRKALEIQPLNLNAWYGLILTYNASDSKTEEQYYELAKEIANTLKYYPLPMYQMTNQIKPKLTSIGASYKFTLLQTRILKEASALPNNSTDVLQPSITRLMGNFLLGQMDTSIATFSFDGEDAGKIVLSNRFDGNGIRWDYSLDGKKTWNEISFTADEEHKLQLTEEEINSITSENDIYVHIVGVNYSEENLYKIDILESAGLPSILYANDLENKLMGAIPTMQWKLNENDEWTYYKEYEPDLTGNRDIIVKAGATGVHLASNNSVTYHFTEDIESSTRKYIPISHLSVHSASSEATAQGRNAVNAIDGNINTNWHSAWDGSDRVKTIVIKLDEPKNLTALEFFPVAGGNGKIVNAVISVSMDGENWTEVVSQTNWTYRNSNDITPKSVDFEPTRGQYIKIVGKVTQAASSSMSFIAASMFNFYEDVSAEIVAEFSFDGNNAGRISLFDEYKTRNWKYSIDGGVSWKTTSADNHQLTPEELEQITEENKIKILFDGDETQYRLNIKKGIAPQRAQYVNDLENRLIGISNTDTLEWKIDNGKWTSFEENEPIVTGSRTLYVRTKATGINTASDSVEYNFTEDNQPNTAKYIPVKHLSIHSYSTQSIDSKRPYYAPNVIDANINTLWHTDFRYDVRQQEIKPFICIKLDEARYISTLEFIQKKYRLDDPDYIKNARVYVSMDAQEWTQVGTIENCPQDTQLRRIEFSESVKGQYVKLEMDTYGIFASAAMINLYEDRTKIEAVKPTAEIEYSTEELTNKDVVAKLVNASTDIEVTNNDGNEYTFTENGSFTFEFVDKDGNEGTAIATVDWIDKDVPTAEIEYSTTENTIEPVTVILKPSEEIEILNENLDYTENEDGSYSIVFDRNTTYTFEFKDKAGNIGAAEANIDWIKDPTTVKVTYDITSLTNKDVTATIKSENARITIDNNNGSNSYTFTQNGTFTFDFTDEYGISRSKTVKVDWIDKTLPTAQVSYSTTQNTLNPVTVTLTPSEKITILNEGLEYTKNEDGTYDIVYKSNGTYTIKFVDDAGNCGQAIATIDCIREKTKVSLSYSTKELTNQDVVVTLSANNKITVDNNNGSNEYIFTKNGSFTFEYTGEFGVKGEATATVDWIDKDVPIGEIEYNITESTANPVRATLKTNEEVEILNNNGNEYTFTENGSFKFEFVDKAGNKGEATATVSWINKIPGLDLIYSTTEMTNQDVEVMLVTTNDVNIEITNNSGNNKYVFTENKSFTFDYVDEFGVKGSITATVDWINKTIPTVEVTYNTQKLTNKNVIATLKFSEEITILNEELEITKNEDGTYTIVFEKNTNLLLEFKDKVGNKGQKSINVDWIDKELPTATFEFSTQDITIAPVTVTLKPSKKVKILNNNGSDTYTLDKNGEFTFEFEDEAGNRNSATVKVTWIREAPKLRLVYSTQKLTNEDVTVTLVADLETPVNIVNNNGSNQYTFKKNESFKFDYIDEYGIAGSITATVDWIDKTPPTATVEYDITTATKENVIATIKFDKKVKALTEDAYLVEYENNVFKLRFEYNSKRVIEFEDEAGNRVSGTLNVDWIDKTIPTAEVSYITTEATNDDVDVVITFSEDVIILNQDLNIVNIENVGNNEIFTIRFNENGEHIIEFVDKVGNRNSLTVSINNIDKDIPTAQISYSTTETTNKDVIATVKFNEEVEILTEGLEIEDKGNNTYELKVAQNGEYIIEFIDKAGNKGTITAKVDNIDKDVPTAKVSYSTTEITNKDVIATIIFDEDIEILTENVNIKKIDNSTYKVRFEDNDEIELEFKDKAGNVGKTAIKVDWIQILPNINISYDITTQTKENVTVTITADDAITITNNDGKNTYTFNENGEFIFEYIDKYGNEGKVIAKVDWIVKDTDKPVSPIEPIKPSEDEKDKPSEDQNQINENNSYKNDQIAYIPNYNQVASAGDKEDNNLIKNDYNYSQGDILVKISTKQDIKNATLINKKLTINKEFESLVGSLSEALEIYLVNGNQDRIDLETSNIAIRFKLDSTKVFDGIYKIKDDSTLEKIDYEYIDEESIQINTQEFGKYILSYNEKQEQNELQKDDQQNTSNSSIIIVVSTIMIIAIAGIIIVVNKKRN